MNESVNSIKDIARILDISPSTVSRILNKKGRYSKDTEKKVLELVEESGFVYNMSARGLKSSKTYTIGFMIPDISNNFFGTLALIIERFFKEHGYSLYICNTNSDPKEEYKYFNLLASNRVDGILCISQLTHIPKSYYNHPIPMVALDRQPIGDFPISTVLNNDYQISYEIGEFLINKGCKNIYVLSNTSKKYITTSSSFERCHGFIDALEKRQQPLDNEHIIRLSSASENTIHKAERAIKNLIESKMPVDGIFALNDRLALGAVNAFNEAGIKIPDSVKIIGFDNSLYSTLSHPPISTVDRNIKRMAEKACDRLLELMNNKTDKNSYEKIIIPATIIERESTK